MRSLRSSTVLCIIKLFYASFLVIHSYNLTLIVPGRERGDSDIDQWEEGFTASLDLA